MSSEGIQGDEWNAYVTLDTYSRDERGIACRARAPWRHSARSSRRSHDLPGRTGRPSTGRRGTGDRTSTTREVCEMQNAETVLGVLNHWRATCIERCPRGSEGSHAEKDLSKQAPRRVAYPVDRSRWPARRRRVGGTPAARGTSPHTSGQVSECAQSTDSWGCRVVWRGRFIQRPMSRHSRLGIPDIGLLASCSR
jgi:hypothetical protein